MNYRMLLAGLAAGLLFYAQTGAELALAAVPKDAPKDIQYILGFYYGNGENILIRENNGRLSCCTALHWMTSPLLRPIFIRSARCILIPTQCRNQVR